MSTKEKSWREGSAGEPKYPDNFEIVKKAVLQNTNIGANNNKYYGIELHRAKGSNPFRVYTHYGRTDDLENNPMAGVRECRYFDSEAEADKSYTSIYKQKTSPKKNYREVDLASSNIGSNKAKGQSSGNVDSETLAKLKSAPKLVKSTISPKLAEIVSYLYSEAKQSLTSQVAAKITANGIETPLGVLTLGQIEKGEGILQDILALCNKKKAQQKQEQIIQLSSQFYSTIPHRIGRTKDSIQSAVLFNIAQLDEKQQTLQLMRDMLQVNGSNNVLFSDHADDEYKALNCEIEPVEGNLFKELKAQIEATQRKSKSIKVKNIYKIKRAGEAEVYDMSVGNERQLYHGSRIQNWVGILSRGILLPKIVTTLGVKRTDAGWLGSGIYFGDAICTSYYYSAPGRRSTRFAAVTSVALGKPKQYRKITYNLSEPPAGYDSCHGVRGSEFADDEYVVYQSNRQKLEYMLELA